MRTIYLDCQMGAAGDMLTAALIELLPEPGKMIERLNGLGIPGVHFEMEPSVKCGIKGTHISVTVHGEEEDEHMHEHHHGHEHHHHHSGLADIEHIVSGHLDLPEKVKKDVLSVFGPIAEAESHVHGVPVTEIHFHEVGTMDAVADITAVCLIMNELAADEVIASPVHVGSGQVKCAHGILPVPAPATAYLLQDIPSYSGNINGELCTPTGAALLKHFVTRFGNMPVMRTSAIGYGMGRKDFEAANCVRAMIGETTQLTDTITDLSCNVDDMTAEAIGFAMDRLYDGGALEVFTVPVGMKKCRPGTLIHVFCKPQDEEKIVELIFKHTTTIGIRKASMNRFVMDRHIETVDTEFGPIRRKASTGYGTSRSKYEHDDLARIAAEQGLSLAEVINKLC